MDCNEAPVLDVPGNRATGMRVIVIGAGPAGAAAAHRLHRLGAEGTLLGACEHVGGRTATLRRDGWVIDTGAFIIGDRTHTATNRLIDELGRRGSVEPYRCDIGLHDGTRLHVLRGNSPLSLLTLGL